MSEDQLQSVDRSPPDIFSRIARYIPRSIFGNKVGPIVPLIYVWGEPITSEPRNLVRISNRDVNAAKRSLEGCNEAPLELSLDFLWTKYNYELFDLIEPKIENIEVLEIRCSDLRWEVSETFQRYFRSTPNLRSELLCQNRHPFGLFRAE